MSTKSKNVITLRTQLTEPAESSRDLVIEWFNTYRGKLLRYARRMLPTSESAEDVVQDVFYRLLRQKNLLEMRNPQAYLMVTARNVVIDRLRSARSVTLLEEAHSDESMEQPTLAHLEMLIAIEKGLQELPERCRQVFVLKRFKGMDTAVIAETLGISQRMVQKHLAKAMVHLFDRLT